MSQRGTDAEKQRCFADRTNKLRSQEKRAIRDFRFHEAVETGGIYNNKTRHPIKRVSGRLVYQLQSSEF